MNLCKLTDECFLALVDHYFEKIHGYMVNHGGGSFGYDWPTFAINFPGPYAVWCRLKAEAFNRRHLKP